MAYLLIAEATTNGKCNEIQMRTVSSVEKHDNVNSVSLEIRELFLIKDTLNSISQLSSCFPCQCPVNFVKLTESIVEYIHTH